MSRGPWIQTYTGRRFYPLDPRPEDVDLEDISHSLSNICRFNGHTPTFYSVGHHSLMCMDVARRIHPDRPDLWLWALLHDAPEAYIGDHVSPIKPHLRINYWSDQKIRVTLEHIEGLIMRRIADRFGLSSSITAAMHGRYIIPQEVRDIDRAVLAHEARELMAADPADWGLTTGPLEGLKDWGKYDRQTVRAMFTLNVESCAAEAAAMGVQG
jgi:hypothetical protein